MAEFVGQSSSLLGSVIDTVKKPVLWAGEFLAKGAHAQQALPSQHRLRAAGGMFFGWLAGDALRDYIFGVKQKSEGEYVELRREEVPLPLRFLHKTIDWNPHSDAPEDQYKKILYQCIPMLGAGLGTLAGSLSAFGKAEEKSLGAHLGMNSRDAMYKDFLKADKLSPLQADMASHYAQAGTFRVLTAGFGGFSAASMLNIVYGMFLNTSFLLANGARAFGFGGGLEMGNFAAHRAAEKMFGGIGNYVKAYKNGDKNAMERYATVVVDRVIKPLFNNKDLKDPAKQKEVRDIIKNAVQNSYERNQYMNPSEVEKAVAEDVRKFFGATISASDSKKIMQDTNILNADVIRKLGLDVNDITLGEAFPGMRSFLEKVGFVGEKKSNHALASKISGYTGMVHNSSAGYSPSIA